MKLRRFDVYPSGWLLKDSLQSELPIFTPDIVPVPWQAQTTKSASTSQWRIGIGDKA